MNLVVIDSGNRLCVNLNSEQNIRKLLDDSDCKIYYFNDEDKLAEHHYKLSELFDISEFDRLIFISQFSSGIMSYHHEFFANNTEFKKMTITIVDMEYEIYQKQIIRRIDSILDSKKILYNILVDTSDSLSATAKECKKPLCTQKTLSVISKNSNIAKKIADLFTVLLSEWRVVVVQNPSIDDYDNSNSVIFVGEQIDDLNFAVPESGIGKYLFWLNTEQSGYDRTDLSELEVSIQQFLMDSGWNIYFKKDIFISNIIYEEFYANILSNTYSVFSLFSNEKFVMWDKYGLPVINSRQNEKEILDFFDRICCVKKILQRVS